MKKTALLLLLLTSFIGVKAQTTYQLNYDSIRVGKTDNSSGIALYGDVYLKNTAAGLMRLNADRKFVTTTLSSSDIPSLAISKVTGLQDSLTAKINKTEKGVANGVATLNSSGKLTNSQVPAIAISETFVVASEASMLALSAAEQGDVAVRTDLNKSFILTNNTPGTLASWQELLTPTDAVSSVNGQTGTVTLSASDVGAEPSFSKNTAFNKNFGTTAGTVVEGGTLGSNAYSSTDYLPVASPTFTGTLTGPTATFNTTVGFSTVGYAGLNGTNEIRLVNLDATGPINVLGNGTINLSTAGSSPITFATSGSTRYTIDASGNNTWTGAGQFNSGELTLNAPVDNFAQLLYKENGTLKWNTYNDFATDEYRIGNSSGTKYSMTQDGNNTWTGSGTFGGDLSVVKTSPLLVLERVNTSSNSLIQYKTGATIDWYAGTGVSGSNSNYHVYNNGLGTDALLIDKTTNAITLSGALTGTSATFSGDVTVPDEAYGSGWNSSLEVPTKNTVYDKIESLPSLTTASGTYTPTVTAGTNVATASGFSFHYTRVGNEVTVYGLIQATASTISSNTRVYIPLPIASNFTTDYDGTGLSTTVSDGGANSGYLYGDDVNDYMIFKYNALSTSTNLFAISFTYTIK